jgi:perosamine synthetase
LPLTDPGCGYHQYVVRHPERDRLRQELSRDHGVGTGIHYTPPLHTHPAFADPDAELPNTERLSRTVLSLPIQPDITAIHQPAIIEAVRDVCLR